jgi:diguanylate cyclase (GGDEF)-like protein
MRVAPFNQIIAIIFRGNRKNRLLALVVLVLSAAFLGTALLSYKVSTEGLRDQIVLSDLPLTSDNAYSQVEQDFIAPIRASELMAADTFLRDWAIGGEKDVSAIETYLAETKRVNKAFTTYFVSETTHRYFIPGGILKTVSHADAHDVWFFDLEHSTSDYVIELDTDQDHNNALTMFINYRVFDYQGHYLGIAGMGLNVDSVHQVLDRYRSKFGRLVYFIDQAGKIVLSGDVKPAFTDISKAPGLSDIAASILKGSGGSYMYVADRQTHLLNVRYVPELHWYLVVERVEEAALSNIRRVLYVNLLIAVLATTLVAWILGAAVSRFHAELDQLATVDALTGLINRRAYDLLFQHAVKETTRANSGLSLIMFDIDHFKHVNDQFGHQAGDQVIKAVAETIKARRRASDIACRWGGEEILLLLPNCRLDEATVIAEEIRAGIERTGFQFGARTISVTVSAGVAEMAGSESGDSVLARADEKLYAAKRDGRNRVMPAPAT